MKQKKLVLNIFSILVVLGAFYFGFTNTSNAPLNPDDSQSEPRPMALSGTYACLPYKNPDMPHTLECRVSIQGDDGFYYLLDTNFLESMLPEPEVGNRISGEGIFTPIEMLSTDQWQVYNVRGIFSITSVTN